jgi:hypothetical protein
MQELLHKQQIETTLHNQLQSKPYLILLFLLQREQSEVYYRY